MGRDRRYEWTRTTQENQWKKGHHLRVSPAWPRITSQSSLHGDINIINNTL